MLFPGCLSSCDKKKLEYKQTEDKWTNEVVFCLSGVSWTLVVLHALTLFVYMYSMRWTVTHESFSESPRSHRNRNKHLSSAGKQNDCESLQRLHLASNTVNPPACMTLFHGACVHSCEGDTLYKHGFSHSCTGVASLSLLLLLLDSMSVWVCVRDGNCVFNKSFPSPHWTRCIY